MGKQSTQRVFMIRPANFGVNPETAASNIFQEKAAITDPAQMVADTAREFDQLVELLRDSGVNVRVFDDPAFPAKPDAVFPNNWISTHADGTVVLYAMMAENRRDERRLDILDALTAEEGCRVDRLVDFSTREARNSFLEGTGSLVLDHGNRLAFACLSPRTHRDLVEEWAEEMNFEKIIFEAGTGPMNEAIYHTNVLMCVGTDFAVLGLDCINNKRDANRVASALRETGRDIIELSQDQVFAFAGNMLELESQDGTRLLLMSETAHANLAPAQREKLSSYCKLLVADIRTIERCAGGSVRCMIAENFLPPANKGEVR